MYYFPIVEASTYCSAICTAVLCVDFMKLINSPPPPPNQLSPVQCMMSSVDSRDLATYCMSSLVLLPAFRSCPASLKVLFKVGQYYNSGEGGGRGEHTAYQGTIWYRG
jgi:hypothetical protein